MKDKILFIVNPISGTGKQSCFSKILSKELDTDKFDYEIISTKYAGHATEICKELSSDFKYVAVVGGDGTVNEVVRGLLNTKVIMGIIPVGSGNGLARHLNIPVKLKESIQVINKAKSAIIDTGTVNGEPFVNVAGIGFDAHVAHKFAQENKRGAIPYVKLAALEFQKYKPLYYEVFIEGVAYHLNAFLISFANSSQFGNNAYISPHASMQDGLIDFCLMRNFPIVGAVPMAIKLFNKRMDKSRYMNIVRGTTMKIISQYPIKGHIDGEPVSFPNEIEVRVNAGSLRVICN